MGEPTVKMFQITFDTKALLQVMTCIDITLQSELVQFNEPFIRDGTKILRGLYDMLKSHEPDLPLPESLKVKLIKRIPDAKPN